MCRVILASKKAVMQYNGRHELLPLLFHLEVECGGHGNGYALLRKGKIIKFEKGVDLKNEDIVRVLLNENYDWMIWHTRIASIGEESDANCHPFVANDSALAMNGTEHDFRTVADALGATDSEVIFRLVQRSNYAEATKILKSLRSVFVGFIDGKPYAIKNSGALEKWAGGEFFASSFPKEVKIEKLENNAHYLNGALYKGKAGSSSTYFNTSYSDSSFKNYSSSYDTPRAKDWWDADPYDVDYDWEEGFVEGYREGLKNAEIYLNAGASPSEMAEILDDSAILKTAEQKFY
jgi:predicted glutamine amidotransferase